MEKKKKTNNEKYGEMFKICTEKFIENLKKDSFTVSDIDYLSGYFVFEFGKNSVVHFKVKECPGWLFGIWWGEPKITYKKTKTGKDSRKIESKVVNGEFFGQYEECIDKFKPEASSICETIYVNLLKDYCCSSIVPEQLNFIAKEPALAFCKEYCGYDYNIEHVTRREAEKEFKKYKKGKKVKDKYTKICNDKVFKFIKKKVLPFYNGSEISDGGENIFPRYMIKAPLELNRDLFAQRGIYDLEEEFIKEFDAIIKKCEKIADRHDFYWHRPMYSAINIYVIDKPKKDNKKAK